MKKFNLASIQKIVEFASVDLNINPLADDYPLLVNAARQASVDVLFYLLTIPGLDIKVRDKVGR